MRKRILLLVLALTTAGEVFGQEWYNSCAPGIGGAKFFINSGIGLCILPYKISIPPISMSIEYALPNRPLFIGGYLGITGYDEELSTYSSCKGRLLGIGAKASYHFNFVTNLDPYVSLVLGWQAYSQEVKITESYTNETNNVENDLSGFLFGFNLGARYFFTENIGAYAELGYNAVSIFSTGLTVKF